MRVAASAVLIAGLVFALQGSRLLPSKVMYGRVEWIVIGIVLALGSSFVLWRSFR